MNISSPYQRIKYLLCVHVHRCLNMYERKTKYVKALTIYLDFNFIQSADAQQATQSHQGHVCQVAKWGEGGTTCQARASSLVLSEPHSTATLLADTGGAGNGVKNGRCALRKENAQKENHPEESQCSTNTVHLEKGMRTPQLETPVEATVGVDSGRT